VIGVEIQKNPWNRGRNTVEKGLVLQVKCPSLLTDHNRTNTNGSAREVSDSFGVSERSVK
jgi:hypothetical protein